MYKYKTIRTIFNITNVCNFACDNCNTFSNYSLKGHQLWKDYAEEYSRWSKIFDVGRWQISGGEPLTNSDWISWVQGVHALWPNNVGNILTNGSLLLDDKNKNDLSSLYSIMSRSSGKLTLIITPHRNDELFKFINFAKEFLGPSMRPHGLTNFEDNFISHYQNIKSHHWPNIQNVNDWHHLPAYIKDECEFIFNLTPELSAEAQLQDYVDNITPNSCILFENHDNVKIEIKHDTKFYFSTVKYIKDNDSFKLHNSDPDIAHTQCQDQYCKIGTSEPSFIKGKLYKCNTSKLLSDFDRHYKLDISDYDRKIIHSYIPGSLDMSDNELTHWFENLHNKINMCKFCPEDYSYSIRKSIHAKDKIIRINKS